MFADAKPAGDAPPTLVANNAACNNNVEPRSAAHPARLRSLRARPPHMKAPGARRVLHAGRAPEKLAGALSATRGFVTLFE